MMELKRFRAVGGNGLLMFDVGLGTREERKERKEGSRANQGSIWPL